jgi:hypothetical protein
VVAGRETTIKVEVDALHGALLRYKADFGSFPPDGSDQLAINQHLARRFRRYSFDPANPPIKAGDLTPAQSLVFWLSPFSADPYDPLNVKNGTAGAFDYTSVSKTQSYFEFQKDRFKTENYVAGAPTGPLKDQIKTRIPVYAAAHGDAGQQPYVYFDARTYLLQNNTRINVYAYSPTSGVAAPYFSDKNGDGKAGPGEGQQPDSFQLVSAGLDGVYGTANVNTAQTTGRFFPVGLGYDPPTTSADDDNVVNFTQERNLGAAKP